MTDKYRSDLSRWILRKDTAKSLPQAKTLLAAIMLSMIGTQGAFAACGSSSQRLLPNVLAGRAMPLPQESTSEDSTQDREHASSDNRPSITGLWRTVFTSGGAIVKVGFNVWHSDGTEWALDSLSPPFQGNTCAGVWEKVGRRTYRTIHPAFNYDAAGLNVIGIFIERLKVTLRADGKEFDGEFTFDNYDFQGNLLSGSIKGAISATRIEVSDSAIPIPLK